MPDKLELAMKYDAYIFVTSTAVHKLIANEQVSKLAHRNQQGHKSTGYIVLALK